MYPQELPAGVSVFRRIMDDRLKNRAIYGVDFGKALGQQNVSYLCQGEMTLKEISQRDGTPIYEITATDHVVPNGTKLTGPYEAVLFASHRGDRNNFGIGKCRAGIIPIGSRNWKGEL